MYKNTYVCIYVNMYVDINHEILITKSLLKDLGKPRLKIPQFRNSWNKNTVIKYTDEAEN